MPPPRDKYMLHPDGEGTRVTNPTILPLAGEDRPPQKVKRRPAE